MELKVNKDLEKVIPKMFPEQYETLKESIKERGQEQPIEIMSDGTIIDGHHRFQACKELGLEPKYKILDKFKTLEDAKAYAIIINIARRHLNSFQKAEMGMELLKVEEELAKLRQQIGLKGPKEERKGRTLDPIGSDVGRVTEIVSRKIGLSKNTFQRAKRIIEKAPEGLKDLVREEKLEIHTAYRLVQFLDSDEHPVPTKKREEFYNAVINADDKERTKVLEKVCSIVEETNTAKSLLELTEEEIAKSIEAKCKGKFYTEELKADDVRYEIEQAEGRLPKLKKVYVPWTVFENEEDPELAAEVYFKKYGGRFKEKLVVTMAVGEVDPHKWKMKEEEE